MLSGLGLNFEIAKSDLDESALPNESAETTARRLSLAKAQEIASLNPDAWVLGADTLVVIGQRVLGKPLNESDAAEMLGILQGNTHQVFSAFSLVNRDKSVAYTESFCSHVKMLALTKDQIKAYIRSGEPMDKAGSYAIQGIGAALIEEVQGSYTNVVGLNLSAVLKAMLKFAILNA